MNKRIRIAIDTMGGDRGPESVVAGAALSKERNPDISFLFFGNENEIEPLIEKRKNLKDSYEIIHSSEVIKPEEKPSIVLRNGKKSSMVMAIDSVSKKETDAIVSSGNTGALMAISKLRLRTLDGITRPAMAATIPHQNGEFVMLDLGANLDCDAENLTQFAVMGSEFAKVVLGQSNPKIAILNVGTENEKGKNYIQEASNILKQSFLSDNFIGYIEGDGITKGYADVVVADGYAGNIALKTAEGIAKLCGEYIKGLLKESLMGKIAYILLKPSFLTLKEKLDPRNRNGALFLGLNGIVVKSHGSADMLGFAAAIDIAVDMVKGGSANKIIENLKILNIKQLRE